MKKILMVLSTFFLLMAVSACTVQDRVGRAANKVVTTYCKKPQGKREVVRSWIDAHTDPHQIRVVCAGDKIEPDSTSEVNQLF